MNLIKKNWIASLLTLLAKTEERSFPLSFSRVHKVSVAIQKIKLPLKKYSVVLDAN